MKPDLDTNALNEEIDERVRIGQARRAAEARARDVHEEILSTLKAILAELRARPSESKERTGE